MPVSRKVAVSVLENTIVRMETKEAVILRNEEWLSAEVHFERRQS